MDKQNRVTLWNDINWAQTSYWPFWNLSARFRKLAEKQERKKIERWNWLKVWWTKSKFMPLTMQMQRQSQIPFKQSVTWKFMKEISKSVTRFSSKIGITSYKAKWGCWYAVQVVHWWRHWQGVRPYRTSYSAALEQQSHSDQPWHGNNSRGNCHIIRDKMATEGTGTVERISHTIAIGWIQRSMRKLRPGVKFLRQKKLAQWENHNDADSDKKKDKSSS